MTWQPEREIEIIAGTPPGGGLDRSARALAQALAAGKLLEVPVKVVNVAGDSSRKAWARLAERPADPHVLSISSSNLATDHLLGAVSYRHETDFTPLAILYTEYIAFVASADSPVTSAGDLLKRLGSASVTVALSTALGNPNHIALAKVIRHAGGDVKKPVIRVFDSALDAVADVTAGKADVAAVSAASPVPGLQSGTMRALAVSAPQRLTGLYTSTPTWHELAVDCVIGAWRGVTGAQGLEPEQISFWERTLATAGATPEWRSDLARHYWTATYLDSQALRDYLQREYAEMRADLRELSLLKA